MSPTGPTRTILIADDDPPVRRVLERMLSSPGGRVLAAEDGARALALVEEQAPDLVILDLDLPKLSGWEVLAALRGGARTQLTPVIVLTGAASVWDKVGGLQLGADDYMTKPFCREELLARVESVLRRHRRSLAANPLSRLPGNTAIEHEIARRIREDVAFALFHIDIDRFKAFNDARGFAAGDRVIVETSSLVTEAAGFGFAGHIGGDDFVLITGLAEAPDAARRLALDFDTRATQAGWESPEGKLTLSIGVASTARRRFASYASAAAAASEAKDFLKADRARRHSRFAFDRRASDGPGGTP